jgi:hypothetical protein
MSCADGRNHTPCCQRANVSEDCLIFCTTPLPELSTEHMKCVNYSEPILKCTVEGARKLGAVRVAFIPCTVRLPGPPQHVRLEIVLSQPDGVGEGGSAMFSWEPPMQAPGVDMYEVYLYATDTNQLVSQVGGRHALAQLIVYCRRT